MAGGQSAFGEPSVVLPNQEVAVFGSCQSGKTMLLQRLIDKLCGQKTELCGQILDAGGRHEHSAGAGPWSYVMLMYELKCTSCTGTVLYCTVLY